MKKLIVTALLSLFVLSGAVFAEQNRDRDREHDRRVGQSGEHGRMNRRHRRHYRRRHHRRMRQHDTSHQ